MGSLHPNQIEHYYCWASSFVILWLLQNLAYSSCDTLVSVSDASNLSYKHILTSQPQLKAQELKQASECQACKLGENDEMCSGSDHGDCDCSSGNPVCRCKLDWTGNSCQYEISKISCEKMRNCILCQVHGSGPLAEGNDCEYFCYRNYPTPLIVKTLSFQDDEHLCSFMHLNEASVDCRYFFKYGQINPTDGTIDTTNFYIVAQQEMDCGKPKFPILEKTILSQRDNKSFHEFSKNYEETVQNAEDQEENAARLNASFFTIVFIFVIIALPFVTCVFSFIYNFSNLPCGLCNVFRQSSSKYLRNVRPFPGFVPSEETTVV
ncbi:unnamed protein product [Orchesella dallaii]|uniref:Integrin beta subunit tail domain-containing protein n=1 Tax=Orchesella dallaii TaxID=48710 RepID=A0ABP1QA55_9HEXA